MPDPHADARAKVLSPPDRLDEFLRELERLDRPWPSRVNADPHNVERGLARLVLALVELLRQLMERQAIRRMEGGSLTEEEIERLGETFLLLKRRMDELRKTFGLTERDLNLDLGPLGQLL